MWPPLARIASVLRATPTKMTSHAGRLYSSTTALRKNTASIKTLLSTQMLGPAAMAQSRRFIGGLYRTSSTAKAASNIGHHATRADKHRPRDPPHAMPTSAATALGRSNPIMVGISEALQRKHEAADALARGHLHYAAPSRTTSSSNGRLRHPAPWRLWKPVSERCARPAAHESTSAQKSSFQ